ncbi:UNVERIFIED_CONTAM: Early nodulin-like protein 3 [Sesamum radiatum]|uniref:Early nodulin-like protein 3 n=1 Tax=Sesamum radiatum TaxID=300843 RepID=A0AAW2KKT8_SESRA
MAIITQIYVHLFLVVFAAFTSHSSSHAYQLIVGGKDGWVINPSENYNHWAGRLRFQVNDTLLFKYKKGSDSVLVVNNQDYDTCNTANPILRLDDGNSVFKFDRSGPFFFISGNKSNCDKGQKLIIVVLAVRNAALPQEPRHLHRRKPPQRGLARHHLHLHRAFRLLHRQPATAILLMGLTRRGIHRRGRTQRMHALLRLS